MSTEYTRYHPSFSVRLTSFRDNTISTQNLISLIRVTRLTQRAPSGGLWAFFLRTLGFPVRLPSYDSQDRRAADISTSPYGWRCPKRRRTLPTAQSRRNSSWPRHWNSIDTLSLVICLIRAAFARGYFRSNSPSFRSSNNIIYRNVNTRSILRCGTKFCQVGICCYSIL